jgi:uncharacterized membrane protein YeaQ/YmgE (transglycosylase-associated protein family)
MGIATYTLIGLLVGTVVKKKRSAYPPHSGLLGTNALSVVGAVTGGWSWNLLLGDDSLTGVELGSIIAAVVGALLTLSILYVIRH